MEKWVLFRKGPNTNKTPFNVPKNIFFMFAPPYITILEHTHATSVKKCRDKSTYARDKSSPFSNLFPISLEIGRRF